MSVKFLSGLVAGLALAASAWSAPIETPSGRIQGQTDAGGLTVYKGIPFAAPPVGALRWREPQPVRPWQGVLQADTFAPACSQGQDNNSRTGLPPLKTSEDCLYLNIWVPAHPSGAKLPVMVWIYGGGFLYGSSANPVTSGEKLAAHGVIVVSIAHRVGPLGFLAHPELTAEGKGHGSGNYGMLDQIAALRWVHDNIAAFDGDAQRVTVFGESSGGAAVSILAASPLTKGLFQRVISQSGGSFAPPRRSREIQEGGLLILPLDFAEEKGRAFFATLGVKSLAEARALPDDRLIAATGSVLSGQFWPVLDNYVLPGDQYLLYSARRFNDVPVLIGTNSDEGAPFVPTAALAANYAADVKAGYGERSDAILAAYPPGDTKQNLRSARDLRRDSTFAWSTWTWARLQARQGKAPVYLYYFDHQPPWPAGPLSDWGAAHAAEIPYVFGTLEARPQMKWTSVDRDLSETMMRYWTNFARSGNPNGAALPQWAPFTAAGRVAMYLDEKARTGSVPNLDKLQVMDGYFAWRREMEQKIEKAH